jgi:tRNA G10  N-methylase Trm11
MMSTSKSQIIDESKTLGRKVPEKLSVSLPPVSDDFIGGAIHSWRRTSSLKLDPAHSMMSRVGGFPAPLARYIIAAYSEPCDIVFDPFCGKGTSLLEAALLGRQPVGGDIAPDAVLVSRAKCAHIRFVDVANYVESLIDTKKHLLKGISPDVRLFFHPNTFQQLLSIRVQLLDDLGNTRRRELATFVCGVLLGILHGHSRLSLSLPCNQCFAMAPSYVRRYVNDHGLIRPKRNVKDSILRKCMEYFPRPALKYRAAVFEDTAEACDKYLKSKKGMVNLVVTSPPYLNRQTYIKDSWLRLWFLGHDRHEQHARSMETGNIPVFVDSMKRALASIEAVLARKGVIALVCGQARTATGETRQTIRISDLCLYALDSLSKKTKLKSVCVIRDRKLMKRGSYFAVHNGYHHNAAGKRVPRYAEEEILILRKG